MDLIDDKGRLFGTVNIIDALAVLLVLAVIAAGAALVLGTGDQDTADSETDATIQNATRYATLDLGNHPSYVAERITEGDNTTDGNLTVTDTYRTPTDGGVHVWARVELDGQLVERENETQFAFAGSNARPRSALGIDTDQYTVNGTIHDVAKRNSSLPGGTASVVLRTTTSADKANAIQQGDTYAVANQTVAAVESVDVYPTENPNQKRVVLGATIETLRTNGQQQFLGRPVRIGRALPFETDAYAIRGQVVHRGDLSPPGDRTTTTVTVKLSGVAPEIANAIAAGTTERGSDGVRARITDKRVENATVVLRSQNGTIHEREHPRKKDVYLTVELDARRTDNALYFHGQQLQEGNGIVLDLGSITINGQVVDIHKEA